MLNEAYSEMSILESSLCMQIHRELIQSKNYNTIFQFELLLLEFRWYQRRYATLVCLCIQFKTLKFVISSNNDMITATLFRKIFNCVEFLIGT